MKQKIEKLLVNPFEDCSERTMLLIGLLTFGCTLAVSYFGNVVFDGIIQIHMGATDGFKIVLGNLSNVLILTLGLFALGKMLYKRVRFIDVLNNVLIARIPILFAGLLTIPMAAFIPKLDFIGEDPVALMNALRPLDLVWISIIAIFLLIFIFYFFYLLVVGIKHSVNSKKKKHVFIVIIGVLVLDVIALSIYRGYFI